jgi:hypothetical protein
VVGLASGHRVKRGGLRVACGSVFQPEAGPTPGLGFADQPGPQGVSLDVSADGLEVERVLHGEGFEAALIDGARAGRVPVGVEPLGVGDA